MTEPSPSERALPLVLFPDGEPDEREPITAATVAAEPALQVQLLLRDVRDTTQPMELRTAWLERAWALAEPLSRFGWFSLHLALVRHAALLGDPRARGRALELVEQLHERPGVEVTNQDSTLRDALRRAQRALRVPILARTIGLDIGDVTPRILETAKSDRSTDDRSRIDVLLRILGGVRKLALDDAPIIEMLVAANSSASAYRSKDHDAWFKREAAKTYLARPIYEFDRVPQAVHWRRINAGKLKMQEYW